MEYVVNYTVVTFCNTLSKIDVEATSDKRKTTLVTRRVTANQNVVF